MLREIYIVVPRAGKVSKYSNLQVQGLFGMTLNKLEQDLNSLDYGIQHVKRHAVFRFAYSV